MARLLSPCWDIPAGPLIRRADGEDLAALEILDGLLDRDNRHRAEHPFGIHPPVNMNGFAHGRFLSARVFVTSTSKHSSVLNCFRCVCLSGGPPEKAMEAAK